MKSETKVTAQSREAEFWDKVVERSANADEVLRIEPDAICDPAVPWFKLLDLHRFVEGVFDHVRLRPGMRILDLGCGKGFLSVALAHRGAMVQGIDISQKSIESCRKRADLSGVSDRTSFDVMDCQNLQFADETFDAVCGCFVLHHLDLEQAAREIGRVLKPRGKSAFIETMGLNPLLMLARSSLPGRMNIEKASSDDEYPLDRARLDRLAAHFPGTLGIAFPQLVFFRMGGYVPFLNNAPMRGIMRGMDRLTALVPGLGRMSYFGLVTLDRDDKVQS